MVVIFYIFAGLIVLFSMAILLTKNVLYAAFSLVAIFFSLAGIYVLSNASYVAVAQILVYIGGVLVFIVFGIMLTHKINDKGVTTKSHYLIPGYFIAILLLGGYIMTVSRIDFDFLSDRLIGADSSGDVQTIGMLLMTDYLIPFEIAAVLLLIALIGATMIAGQKPKKQL